MVFKHAKGRSLFTLDSITSMCHLESQHFTSHVAFLRSCYTGNLTCCSSWNLGVYVALLTGHQSCDSVTEESVAHVLNLIMKCSHYYRTKELKPDCASFGCETVPEECVAHNAVFNILHFLVDVDFMSVENPNNDHVSYAMAVFPVYAGVDIKNIYEDNFRDRTVSDGVTTVSGLYFNIKEDLFSEYLMLDIVYPSLGIFSIVILMWIYIGSFFITLMAIVNIAMSLTIAYFLYVVVLRIPFFPFMNLTSVILLVGIGADDTFVFCDVWKQVSRDRTNVAQVILMMQTLNHAALSMFVTSLTTASAFFTNTVSTITSIKCFGIFSGLAILSNFILSITWLPAVIAFQDTYLGGLEDHGESMHGSGRKARYKQLWRMIRKRITDWSRVFFEKVLPFIVIRLRYAWLVLCTLLMVGGFCTIFVYPKLHLPSVPHFQLFQSSHPFEQYDFVYRKLFWFEKSQNGAEYSNLPIIVVWGVKEKDTGNRLDPDSKGSLVLDGNLDVSHPDSQAWLLQFCQRLRNQTFLKPPDGWQLENCFIESLKYWMEFRDCDDVNMAPCCRNATFPYDASLFQYCLEMATHDLHQEYPAYFDKRKPGPRFLAVNNSISALLVEFDSRTSFSYVYEDMKEFVDHVDGWMKDQLETAPEGMSGGWFTSDLDFFDLQDHLARGAPLALGLSVIIATLVLLLTTGNIVISCCAIASIAGTLFVTIGTLVLLGWQLNIMESVILSVAVGLAIDFTVHYGVAYSLAPAQDREGRVVFSLSRMGSAIAMAALTTFTAGVLMMPANILSYTQMGTFLVLITTVSWTFSTFFFHSVCRICGPEGHTGSLSWLCVCCRKDHVLLLQRYGSGVAPVNRFEVHHVCQEYYQSSTSSSESAMEAPMQPCNLDQDPEVEGTQLEGHEGHGPEVQGPEVQGSDTLSTFVSHPQEKAATYQSAVEYHNGHYVSHVVPSSGVNGKPALLPNKDPSIPNVWVKR